MDRMRTVLRVASAVLAAALLGACGQAAADKSGGDATVVTLRLATDDDQGRPGAKQIQQFAAEVDRLSGGRLRIEPVWSAVERADDWDQLVARAVVAGRYDMAMVPSRAWDTEGVTSLRALNAPLLVTSDALLQRVVTDDVTTGMLAGLDRVGVTGLALLPEGLRHLFFLGDAQPSLALQGGAVRAPRSDTVYAAIAAMGGKADDFTDDATFDRSVADGSLVAAESSYALAGTLGTTTTAVGDLTLFPKVNSLVVNTKVIEGLSAERQAVLRDAARRTVDWAVAGASPDTGLAAQYCANGGRIVVAGATEIAGVERAVQPVLDELARDPATAAQLERIKALRTEVGPSAGATAAPCAAKGPDTAALATGEGPFPAGVYRMELPTQVLLDAGVDESTAGNHDGTWTLTFEPSGRVSDGTCGGRWAVEGGRVAVSIDAAGDCQAEEPLFTAGWRREGDLLRFLDVRAGNPGDSLLITTIFSTPFHRAA